MSKFKVLELKVSNLNKEINELKLRLSLTQQLVFGYGIDYCYIPDQPAIKNLILMLINYLDLEIKKEPAKQEKRFFIKKKKK